LDPVATPAAIDEEQENILDTVIGLDVPRLVEMSAKANSQVHEATAAGQSESRPSEPPDNTNSADSSAPRYLLVDDNPINLRVSLPVSFEAIPV
jgi:hypothetical protein